MNIETCTFVAVTELELSDEGMEELSCSSNLTFGDANRTLVTPDRIILFADFSNEDDIKKVEAVKDINGGEIDYIDLEN